MPPARRWRAGLAAAVAVAAVAAWMVAAPRLVASRLEPALRRHVGWSLARIGRVGLSPSGLRLSEVELRRPDGVALGRTRVTLPWSLLRRRPGTPLRLAGATRLAPGASLDWSVELAAAGGLLAVAGRDLPVAALAPLLPPLPWHDDGAGRVDLDIELSLPPGASLAPPPPAGARAGAPAPPAPAGEAPWQVRGRFALREAAFSAPLLAAGPVTGIGLEAGFQGDWRPGTPALGPYSARLGRGGVRVEARGEELSWRPSAWRVDLAADLPESDCGAALAALPAGLLGEAAGFRLDGRLAGRLRLKVDATRLEATELGIRLEDGCRFIAVPAAARRVGAGEMSYGQAAGTPRRTGPDTPGWVPLGAIAPAAIAAVLLQEDAGFYDHAGFSVPDIRASLVRDLQAGGTRRGASTITMQLARSLFLDTDKTLARKVQEVLYAWWLERALSKDRILELYLNVVEFGPRLKGLGEAAGHYFGVHPSRLTPAQGAFLAAILPAPHRRHRQVEEGGLPPDLLARMRLLLRRMGAAGRLGPERLRRALAEAETLSPPVGGDR